MMRDIEVICMVSGKSDADGHNVVDVAQGIHSFCKNNLEVYFYEWIDQGEQDDEYLVYLIMTGHTIDESDESLEAIVKEYY